MKTETWYVLEDGNVADPSKCAPDKTGALAFEGVRVKRRGDTYHSRSVDADAPPKAKEVKPAVPQGAGYKTREAKAK